MIWILYGLILGVDQDKENEFRNHQATQAVIQRRKRPKRRSTGVVHVDFDEIDPDRQDTSSCGGTDDSIGEVSLSYMFCHITLL